MQIVGARPGNLFQHIMQDAKLRSFKRKLDREAKHRARQASYRAAERERLARAKASEAGEAING